MDKNLTVENALKELLAEKKFLLNDSRALVTTLQKHVAPVHAMQLTLFRKALLDANISEALMLADGLDKNARSQAEVEAVARLKEINLPEESAMLVVHTLTEAMDWHKEVLKTSEPTSISDNELKFFPVINNNVHSQHETTKSNSKPVAIHINTVSENDKIESNTSSDTRNNGISVVELFQQAKSRKTVKTVNEDGNTDSKTSNATRNNSISVTELFQWAQRSFKIKEIVIAFNEMMRETDTTINGIFIRQKFIKDYRVIAFKCVNFEERVNRPEVPPRFMVCTISESKLWGVSLSDGTLAVLPGLHEYESTAHYQSGLKELFKSEYISGSYRKIEVIKPAIIKRDYQIIKRGELSLSQ